MQANDCVSVTQGISSSACFNAKCVSQYLVPSEALKRIVGARETLYALCFVVTGWLTALIDVLTVCWFRTSASSRQVARSAAAGASLAKMQRGYLFWR